MRWQSTEDRKENRSTLYECGDLFLGWLPSHDHKLRTIKIAADHLTKKRWNSSALGTIQISRWSEQLVGLWEACRVHEFLSSRLNQSRCSLALALVCFIRLP